MKTRLVNAVLGNRINKQNTLRNKTLLTVLSGYPNSATFVTERSWLMCLRIAVDPTEASEVHSSWFEAAALAPSNLGECSI